MVSARAVAVVVAVMSAVGGGEGWAQSYDGAGGGGPAYRTEPAPAPAPARRSRTRKSASTAVASVALPLVPDTGVSVETRAAKVDQAPDEPGAGPAKSAATGHDVEIWLGERRGRLGDWEFPVLGGREGYPTPTGAYKIEWKSRSWMSKQWDAEMEYACFFSGGAALHKGSLSTTSHGCVHLSEDAARRIFKLCREGATRVMVYP